MPGRLVFWILNSGFRIPCWRPLRPPASPPETLRVTMWAGLRNTLHVAKALELREALRAGLLREILRSLYLKFQPANV
jgi:hypothetical protein